MGRRKKEITQRILILKSGAEYRITDEDGKYYVCGDVKFRKQRPDILTVNAAPILQQEPMDEILADEDGDIVGD